MIGENSLHSVLIALLIFGVIYFAALGIYELSKWIKSLKDRKNKKEE